MPGNNAFVHLRDVGPVIFFPLLYFGTHFCVGTTLLLQKLILAESHKQRRKKTKSVNLIR